MFQIVRKQPVQRALRVFTRGKHHRHHTGRSRPQLISLYSASALTVGTVVGYYYGHYEEKPLPYAFPESSTTSINDLNSPVYADGASTLMAFKKIKALLDTDQYSQEQSELESHSSNDYSTHSPEKHQKPRLVVYPTSTEQVSEILKIANEYSVPVVPMSGGTSIEGNFISTRQGIVLSLSGMDSIISFNKSDLDVCVQPAVGWQDLNEYLAPHGYMIGPDPGPGANIGGMVGTSCSGTNAARYGTMKDNVVNLTVVLADGTIVKTKNRPRKSSAGYNLTNLIIGSEGTLGIVTEITVKLHLKPKYERVSVVSFPRILDAANTVTELIQNGIQVNAVELLDENMIHVINDSGQCKRVWTETPTLFIKLGGNDEKILHHLINKVEGISSTNNSLSFQFARDDTESEELWQARKIGFWSSIEYAKKHVSPDVKVWTTDVAVPISKMSDVIEETIAEIKQSNVFFTVLGHVGDGNFHAILIYTPEQYAIVKSLSSNLVRRALANDGTCTGEHGVGIVKRKYLEEELGTTGVDLMRKIKLAVDPKRILNPDKIFKIDPNDNIDV
ncbi:CYFA0S01e03664g1_1 [Cyberlindnera fabianii]|uniref:D-lactate dehydrogenase (cytochrome) n=1 Tax=Cyberlindnera fabianii TaxID=36022 RepID=A0A061AMW6_CYBFA|nr:CYFA0S01e03664g1_1 [Cyberlindnera fabianii]